MSYKERMAGRWHCNYERHAICAETAKERSWERGPRPAQQCSRLHESPRAAVRKQERTCTVALESVAVVVVDERSGAVCCT